MGLPPLHGGRQGYRYLTTASTEPREGDLVVRAGLMDWPLDKSVTDRLELVDSSQVRPSGPLQVMNFDASAGFYGSHWGKLPYTFSYRPVETFDVYRCGAGRRNRRGQELTAAPRTSRLRLS